MSFFGRKSKPKKTKEKENSSPGGVQPIAVRPTGPYTATSPGLKTSPTNSLTKPPEMKISSSDSSTVQKTTVTTVDKSSVGSTGGAAAVNNIERTKKESGASGADTNDSVFLEDGMTAPPGYRSEKSRRERSISISKSGRHKYKARQRSSVIEGDVFGKNATSSTTASQPTAV